MVHPVDASGVSSPELLGIYELGSGVHSKHNACEAYDDTLADAHSSIHNNAKV
jgi:hypothetical protein